MAITPVLSIINSGSFSLYVDNSPSQAHNFMVDSSLHCKLNSQNKQRAGRCRYAIFPHYHQLRGCYQRGMVAQDGHVAMRAKRASYNRKFVSAELNENAVEAARKGISLQIHEPDVANKLELSHDEKELSEKEAEGRENGHLEAWKKELETVFGHETVEKEGKVWDQEWLQAQIDRRCTDNMRMLVVDSVNNAKAGHPGMAMGIAEVAYTLYGKVMKYNPKNPNWFNRDRFVLSAGHGCLLQYISLHLAGFHSVQIEDLKKLCKLGARTPGHPENVLTAGVEVTTGPLGQGVANAVGLALAERHLAARFNTSDFVIVDHRTFCIMGDGCAMEGISNESSSLAAHWKLNKLTLIYDDNNNTIDGSTKLAFTEDVAARYRALGWHTIVVEDMYHNSNTFNEALAEALKQTERPTFIQVKSRIGRPSKKEGTSKSHHGTFDDDDLQHIKDDLHWVDRDPFYVIPMVYQEFRRNARKGELLDKEWNQLLVNYEQKYPEKARELMLLFDGGLPSNWDEVLPRWKDLDSADATRGYSEKCLNALAKVLPGLIGGSADLASSNKVYLKEYEDFQHETPWGRNIRYGVREHAMAGISNGIAHHGSGLVPFAATFLVFTDYMKNSMRLAALSKAVVLFICTHDSIGLGEDGPTHQPVEHLAGLRAIPNLLVLRPADGNETAGAYKVAIGQENRPSVISLSRQKVESLAGTSVERVEKGGYIVSDNSDNAKPDIILIGTGSELCLCEKAAEKLRGEGTKVRVVSLVCWELFDEQPEEYRGMILPSDVEKRLSVEAGSPLGWREYVGQKGTIVAVNKFGASGPYLDVFKKFGFTAEHVAEKAEELLQS
ncbi:hypothetical protein O6H91_Y523200 [Diphasiastrum complanatum]|nr:hypothetical protein O6H91_Y523200 [Diphasiastrum complanatum]